MSIEIRNPRPATLIAVMSIVFLLGSIALFWPGYAGFDTIDQYHQAVTGHYVDWHPPIMAWLWSRLLVFGGGIAPMFIVQLLFYWIGFAQIGIALAATGRPLAGFAVMLIGAFPEFIGWQAEVLKDTQMDGALLAIVGLMATSTLRDRRPTMLQWIVMGTLLVYATLLRGNAVFVTVPLLIMISIRGVRKRLLIGCVTVFAVLACMPLVDRHLFGAKPTTIARTLPIFDLAGTYAHGGDGTGLTTPEREAISGLHCYKPFFWDPLGNANRCGPALQRLTTEPVLTLFSDWALAIRRDPFAYVKHRIDHLNATERLYVPRRWLAGSPIALDFRPPIPSKSAGDYAIREPSGLAKRFQYKVLLLADTPICWPICWVILAGTCLLAWRRSPRTPLRSLALALLTSSVVLEGSFAVLSIASPLRYHLWPMMATAIALVMTLSERVGTRRVWIGGFILLSVVIAVGAYARTTLPLASTTYAGNL